jgi:CRISPR locus-related DNA-binding protein
MNILISTIYKGSAVIQAIKLFEPEKVYLIVDDPIDDVRKNSIIMIKDIFPSINFIEVSAKIYDIVEIANKTIETIKKESGNKIMVNISEGRKTMSLGLLFGTYVMKKEVHSAFYIVEETNSPIQLPLIEMKISSKRKDLLRKIADGKRTVAELEKETGTNPATLYVHIKELRDSGMITKENKLTEMGRIVLLDSNQ